MQAVRSVDSFLTNINLFSDYITDVLFIQPDSAVVYSMNDILRSGYDYVNAEWFLEASARDNHLLNMRLPTGETICTRIKGHIRPITAFYPVRQSDQLWAIF